jgi:nicotinic acid mononucleotide adenylyltransferase
MSEYVYTTDNADFERLLAQGFTELEATRIIFMKNHVSDQIEYREMVEEKHRLDFIRWLVEHDRLSK